MHDDNDVSISLLLTQVDEVLVCGVGGQAPDVEVGPGQRLSVTPAPAQPMARW